MTDKSKITIVVDRGELQLLLDGLDLEIKFMQQQQLTSLTMLGWRAQWLETSTAFKDRLSAQFIDAQDEAEVNDG